MPFSIFFPFISFPAAKMSGSRVCVKSLLRRKRQEEKKKKLTFFARMKATYYKFWAAMFTSSTIMLYSMLAYATGSHYCLGELNIYM